MLQPLLCPSFSHIPCFSPPDTCKVQQIIKFQDALQPFHLQSEIWMLHIPLKCQWLPRNWEATGYHIEFASQKFPIWMYHSYWWTTFLARGISYIICQKSQALEDVVQRSYKIFVVGGFQDLMGQRPEWPGLNSVLTQVWAEGWTRWPAEVPSNLNYSVL